MNPEDRIELESIRQEHERLRRLMEQMERRIEAITSRVEKAPVPPAAIPRVPEPPPLPKPAPPPVESPKKQSPPLVPSAAKPAGPGPAKPPPPQLPATIPPPRAEVSAASIEMKLGTYWLARLGIVILLTGLVFLGNYAYQHIIHTLGAWGKLSLLALAGGALMGIGAWLDRSRETMRNYARVLIAGGAAAIYYTAYAAHFVESLRVIGSPLIGGALLLVLAGGFIWFADRRRSEPLALAAVLLSYYTAAINPIGTFSLFSNALLTAVAVFFLVRHQWVSLPLASLGATYASYGFWRFHALAATGESGAGDFGMALAFLGGYWLLFTVAVFLAKSDALPPARRAAFLTANNGALFAFAAQHYAAHRPGEFWWFAIGFGAVLLALAALAARRNPEDRTMDGAYLAQGLALITAGLAAKLSGPQLATVLAVESATLLTLSRDRQRLLYEIGSGLCALAAFVLAFENIQRRPELTLSLGGTVALLLIFDAWWPKHLRGELADLKISPRALGFAALGLALGGVVIWKRFDEPWQPAVFAAAALVCAVSIPFARLPEIALPGQAFLFIATGIFAIRQIDTPPDPWWSPLPLIAIAIGLTHWWQHQRTITYPRETGGALQLACAAAGAACGWVWLHNAATGDAWMAASASVAFGSLIYGVATRAWSIAIVGQIFTLLTVQAFVFSTAPGRLTSSGALAPIANLAATAFLVSRVAGRSFPALPEGISLAQIAFIYRITAAALLAVWGLTYVELQSRTVFFAALGVAQIVIGSWRRDGERAVTGAVFALIGIAIFLPAGNAPVKWIDLIAIVSVPASVRIGRHLGGEAALRRVPHNTVVAAALAGVWLWVTRYTIHHGNTGALTAVWAVLALIVLAAGLGLRERVYRIGGFAILAVALARIFMVDVWRLETLYRIISFIILGVVLLLLGYLYNRFADSIRRWL